MAIKISELNNVALVGGETIPVVQSGVTRKATVTNSAIDTTAGRLLKVGDFGVGDLDSAGLGISASGIRIDQGFDDNKYLLLVKYEPLGGSVQGRIIGQRRFSGGAGRNHAVLDINVSGASSSLPAITYSRMGNYNTRLVLCDYLTETWVAVEAQHAGFNSELERARFFGNVGQATLEWKTAADVSNVVAAPKDGDFRFNDNVIYHTGNTIVDSNGFIKEA